LPSEPVLYVLCRSPEQLSAALEVGVQSVIVEDRDMAAYGEAVRTARGRQVEILLATPRIHRPGEDWVFEMIAGYKPDGVLARNPAALVFFARRGFPVVADFSLNATNELTVAWLHDQGASRVTASYDLSRSQLFGLVAAVPPEWLEVVIHLHVPMFHTEYCLWCAHLSAGTDRANCGRLCAQHVLRLRDRKGAEHPVASDGLCRSTIYHAIPQTAAESLPLLIERGVRHFRIDLSSEESSHETRPLLETYRALLAGRVSCPEAWRRLQTLCPLGITRGTLR
jgi:putative protease